MPVIKAARYQIQPAEREAAERSMHEVASRVRTTPDLSWSVYRADGHYLAIIHIERGTEDGLGWLREALGPIELEVSEYNLVTSSDLARRELRRPRRR